MSMHFHFYTYLLCRLCRWRGMLESDIIATISDGTEATKKKPSTKQEFVCLLFFFVFFLFPSCFVGRVKKIGLQESSSTIPQNHRPIWSFEFTFYWSMAIYLFLLAAVVGQAPYAGHGRAASWYACVCSPRCTLYVPNKRPRTDQLHFSKK